MFEYGNKLYMKCSCKCWRRHGYDCPVVFAVSNELPNPNDIAIRSHKVYYAAYLSGNSEIDRVFDDLVENEAPGVMLPCDSAKSF